MSWWDYLNPFTYLGNAAGKVVADGWTAAMLGVWNAGLWLLKLVLGIEDGFLVPDLRQDGPMSGIYPTTFWSAGALVLILVMVQLGIAAFRRDGQSLARVLIGAAQFVMVWAGWVVYAVAVLAAAGGLTRALMQSLLQVDAMAAWQPWTGFSTNDITDGTIATVLGVMGFFLVFAAFGHLLVMLARAASLLVLTATAPVAAAGLVWEGGRSWFWKAFRWFHAAAFTPVLMMLLLGLGVQLTSHVALGASDTLQQAIGTAVPGVVLILVGCFAPLALFKLLAFVDPGTSSGAAMRAGTAAQGGLQGVLQGNPSGSNAASASDPGGSSQGEDSAEAATTQRFASSAGGLMGAAGAVGQVAAAGFGKAVSAGTRAATLGADLTNQMGVGHHTYLPDLPGSRSNDGNAAPKNNRNTDDDNPEINGSGTNDAGPGDSSPSTQPTPPSSPPSPTPSLPQPGSAPGGAPGPSAGGGGPAAGGGSGSAAGGGAAGGGAVGGGAAGGSAAAVPVVPV
ncbi:type IV secretion system protein [Lapillicoccus sp.]|uniref:type IV secretion system protein n=1 Tax=Lapillicoccus sp. TaxID=1909287 RepID=UPI0025F418F7|nr:type IV secretion system protein [Lapillicoccus sp.]